MPRSRADLLATRRPRLPPWIERSVQAMVSARKLVMAVLEGARAHNLNTMAAGIGLYAFLALLPFMASIVLTYGMFVDAAAVQSDVRSLLFMSPGRVQDLVADILLDILARWNGGAAALAPGLLLAVYAAARAARSTMSALNLVYGRERRGILKRWLASIGICLAGGLATLMALLAIATSAYLRAWMPEGLLAGLLTQLGFWLALVAVASALLASLYRYAPNGSPVPWPEVAPGAVTASLLWLLGSMAFSAYVPVFSRYDVAYGSLAAVVVLQLWLYASSLILLLGAQLNLVIRDRP